MEADALTDVGHSGFIVDAQAMAALLYDFATRPDYRAVVKKEFDAFKALHDEYLECAAQGVRAAEGRGRPAGTLTRRWSRAPGVPRRPRLNRQSHLTIDALSFRRT